MGFYDAARRIAADQFDRACITMASTGESICYGAVSRLAGELAQNLAGHGVHAGSRVLVLSPDLRVFLPLLLACEMCGAALTPYDADDRMDDLNGLLTRLAPTIIITSNRQSVSASAKIVHIEDLVEAPEQQQPATSHDPSSPLLLLHTAGTTTDQKLVMLAAGSLLERAQTLQRWFEIDSTDRVDAILPFDHIDSIMFDALVPLVAGAHVFQSALPPADMARLFWRRLTALDITMSHATPRILGQVLAMFPRGRPEPAPSLRYIVCSGAALPPALWQRFEDVFDVRVHHGYGLTEAGGWVTATHGAHPRSWNTAGVPLPLCSLDLGRAVDPGLLDSEHHAGASPREDALSHGVTRPAELLVQSSSLMLGYFKNPKLTQAVLKEDCLRTGDAGAIAPNNSLVLMGRLDDIIDRNGHKVWAPAIDDALEQHPAVVQCRTIGMADAVAGERIHTACVVSPDSRVTAGDLEAWLCKRIPAAMHPDAITIMGWLPESTDGAVSTHLLRQILTGELCQRIFANLNRQRFKRCQPSDPQGIHDRIQEALVSGAPVRFAAYWGCGRRHHVNDSDRKALDRLERFLDGVRVAANVRAELTLIIADMHARLNAKAEARYTQYFSEIEDCARSAGMECIHLSTIWRDAGLSMDVVRDTSSRPEFEQHWQGLELREALIAQAGKHGEADDAEQHARLYYTGCTLESPAITARFPRHIWLTYSDPQLDSLIPELPKIYLFSYRRGTSFRPWFTSNAGFGHAELRRHQRVNIELAARYRFHSFEDFASGRILDLSQGGVFVHTELAELASARVGAPMCLEFTLPENDDIIRVTGTVVRSKTGDRPGFGVEFTKLDDGHRDRLAAFVTECDARAARMELMIDMSTSGIINCEEMS